MITITKLNDKKIIINCELIELVESIPDTTITMNTGRKIIVRESADEVVAMSVAYKKELYRAIKD